VAKATVKLDTKILDQLIKVVGEGQTKTYTVHDGVEYGIYVEFGTTDEFGETKQTAKPALVPAFEKHTKQLPKALGQAIERGVFPDDVLAITAFNIQADYQATVPVDTGALKDSIGVSVE
jgi:hypothetical protein